MAAYGSLAVFLLILDFDLEKMREKIERECVKRKKERKKMKMNEKNEWMNEDWKEGMKEKILYTGWSSFCLIRKCDCGKLLHTKML